MVEQQGGRRDVLRGLVTPPTRFCRDNLCGLWIFLSSFFGKRVDNNELLPTPVRLAPSLLDFLYIGSKSHLLGVLNADWMNISRSGLLLLRYRGNDAFLSASSLQQYNNRLRSNILELCVGGLFKRLEIIAPFLMWSKFCERLILLSIGDWLSIERVT